jgi:hypothetical protein
MEKMMMKKMKMRKSYQISLSTIELRTPCPEIKSLK